jgi:hypothetical protein
MADKGAAQRAADIALCVAEVAVAFRWTIEVLGTRFDDATKLALLNRGLQLMSDDEWKAACPSGDYDAATAWAAARGWPISRPVWLWERAGHVA